MIDADALAGYVTELYEYDLSHDDADDYTEGRASAEHYILEKIRELPTIPAIPVEWLRKKREVAIWQFAGAIDWLLSEWQKEQEAQDVRTQTEND